MSSSSTAYIVAPNPNFNAAPIPYTVFDGATAVTSTGAPQLVKTSAITFPAGTYLLSTEIALNFDGTASASASDVVYVSFYATTGTPTISPNCTIPTSVPGTGAVFSQTLTGMIVLPVASTITLSITNVSTFTGKSVAWSGTTYQRIA